MLSVGELVGYLRLEGGAQFDRGIAAAKGEMSSAAQSAQRMAGAMGQAEANLARAGRQSNVAAEGAGRLRAANLTLLAATERYNALLGQENVSLGRLAAAEASVIRANERVAASTPTAAVASMNAEAARTTGVMGRTAGSMASAAKSALGLGAAFGAFELVKHAIDSGKELTDALNGVQAVSRATDEQMQAVRTQAIALGKDLTVPGATAIDAAHAILELVKAGIQLPRALEAARPALLLASATQTGMADTARVLGDTMDIWSIKGKGAAHTAAILGSSALGASHDLVGLFDALKQAGPSARALNIGLDDTATTLVFLAKHGLSTGLGGTGLKVLFSTLAKGTPAGTKALKDLGVTAFDTQGKFEGFPKLFDQLHSAQGRFGVDSYRFLHDLNAAFGSRAQNVAALFATATGKEFDELRKHLEAGDLQKFADQMNRGVSASFRQLQKEATAAGIDAFHGAEPALTALMQLIGKGIPVAVALGTAAVHPFAMAWHAAGGPISATAHALADVLGFLHPVAPLLEGAAAAALAMYAAFKGYTIVRAALTAILDRAALMSVQMRNAASEAGVSMGLMARDSGATAAVMQADLAAMAAAATEEAAAIDRAAANAAEAQLALAQAIGVASDEQIAAYEAVALASVTQAEASEAAAVQTATAAESAAAAVVASGEEAEVGWAGLAGPLGIAAVGVLALVTMFHKSTNASKEAKDAAKAYSEALSSGGKSDLVDTISKQLKDNGLSGELQKINAGLGRTAFTGKQFVDAISSGNPALGKLKDRLEAVVTSGTKFTTVVAGRATAVQKTFTPAAVAAQKALKSLDTQYNALTKTAAKDLLDTKTFAGAAGAIQKTTAATKLGTEAAKQYATMAGLEVDKNGIVAASQNVVNAAVSRISDAYDTATQSGSEYLAALSTFSKSAGTASDRAAMIGATLKAANGDALGFASAMNAGAAAATQLDTDIASAAKGVGKSGVSVRSFIRSIVDLKTGTINYSKTAAGPLINDLQGMQTSAMNAASAMFQHERSTKGAKVAADDAYDTFQRLTTGALVGQAKQLGLTTTEAQKLAERYYGMPKDVKTAIEAEGVNPVVDVLNRIGQLLANLTGQSWDIPVNVIVSKILNVGAGSGHGAGQRTAGASAAGSASWTKDGKLPPGLSTVGERGWELVSTDASGKSQVFSHAQSVAMTGMPSRLPGFASGTGVESAFASLLASLGVGRAGQAGALGNGQAESNFNTRALNSIGALGVFQWLGGRKAGLEALAHRMGVGANTEAAQLAFFKKELTGPFKNVLNGLRHAKSARSAATLFNEKFEISGDTSGNRENNAARIYNQLKSGKLAVTGGTGGKTGLTQVANSSAALNAYNALGKAVKIGRDPTKGTPSATVLADLQRTESALTKAGASAQFVASITKQNKRITALAYARNVAASHLAAATKAVAAAVDTFNQDKASFKSAGVGSFDLTSAGADANGRVTRGSLLASQAQTVTKVRSWVTGMKRLIASKVFPGAYLRTLLGDGPASLPTVQALLQMSAADMKSFAANERTIDSLSGQIASAGAHKLDDPAIAAAKATQAKDAAIEARLQHRLEVAIDQVGDRVANELSHLNIQSKIGYKQGDLWIAVESDKKKSTHRKATSR